MDDPWGVHHHWRYRDHHWPSRVLRISLLPTIEINDFVLSSRIDALFVSARGRMRAPARAHYARARVNARAHARARYVVTEILQPPDLRIP